jgi:hypothetical protein
MLEPLRAHALLTVRMTLRSRLFLCVAAALAAVVFGMPSIARGDGTLVGEIVVDLRYTYAVVMAVLGAAVLWGSCASVSKEYEGRQTRLTAVKPAPAWEVWAGKWLGALIPATLLLALAGSAALMLPIRLRPAGTPPAEEARARDELFTVRLLSQPEPEDLSGALEARVARLRALSGAEEPERELRREALAHVRAERATVAPGAARRWTFRLPAAADRALRLRYRVLPASGVASPIRGEWRLLGADGAVAAAWPADHRGRGRWTLDLPPAALPAGRAVTLEFANGGADISGTAVFAEDDSVELLAGALPWPAACLRVLLMSLFTLAALAALGTTLGCLFSFPVAAGVAFAVMAMLPLAAAVGPAGGEPSAHDHHGHDHGPALANACERGVAHAGAMLAAGIRGVARPLLGERRPADDLADGVAVPGAALLGALAVRAVLLPLAAAALGAAALRRREAGS